MARHSTQRGKQIASLLRKAKLQLDKRAIRVWADAGHRVADIVARLAWRKAFTDWCCRQKNAGQAERSEVAMSLDTSRATSYRMIDRWLEVPGAFTLEDGWLTMPDFEGGIWNTYVREQQKLRAKWRDQKRHRKLKKSVSSCDETNPADSPEAVREAVSELRGESSTTPLESVLSAKQLKQGHSDPPPSEVEETVRRERLLPEDEAAWTAEDLRTLSVPEQRAWLGRMADREAKAIGAEAVQMAMHTEFGHRMDQPDAFRVELIAHLNPTPEEVLWATRKAAKFKGEVRNFGALVTTAIKKRRFLGWV